MYKKNGQACERQSDNTCLDLEKRIFKASQLLRFYVDARTGRGEIGEFLADALYLAVEQRNTLHSWSNFIHFALVKFSLNSFFSVIFPMLSVIPKYTTKIMNNSRESGILGSSVNLYFGGSKLGKELPHYRKMKNAID